MQIFAIFVLMYLAVGSFIYLLACVTPNRPGFLGALYRLVYVKTPTTIGNLMHRVAGEALYTRLLSLKNFITRTNHPLVQGIYLLTMVGGFAAYDMVGVRKYMPNSEVGRLHIVVMHFLFVTCLYCYYRACTVSPGKIDSNNEEHYLAKYGSAYDQVLYLKSNRCKTCDIVKPPRSKHCSVCDMCVPNFDHHSIWIRKCVGEKNRKYFLVFLLSQTVLTLYLAVAGTYTLKAVLQHKREMSLKLNYSSRSSVNNFFITFSFLFIQNTLFCFLIALCYIASFALMVFDSYQLYLIKSDRTSHERRKGYRVSEDLKQSISEEECYILQKGGVGSLPEQVEFQGERMTKGQFVEKHEEKKRHYEKLNTKRVSSSYGQMVSRLSEIFLE